MRTSEEKSLHFVLHYYQKNKLDTQKALKAFKEKYQITDSEEDDAECMILKDMSGEEDAESVYEVVEDEVELSAVLKVFEELLEDIDIER